MAVTVPNALALATIADGSSIVASDHRNNYAAAQVGVNGLIAMYAAAPTKGDLLVSTGGGNFDKLAVGADGQAPVADSTQPTGLKYAFPPGYEIVAASIVADVTNLVAGADTDLVVFAAKTFEAVKYYLDISIPTVRHTVANTRLLFKFKEGAAQVGKTITAQPPSASGDAPVRALIAFTPTAAAHTYKITWDISVAGTGTIVATAFDQPEFRIFKA